MYLSPCLSLALSLTNLFPRFLSLCLIFCLLACSSPLLCVRSVSQCFLFYLSSCVQCVTFCLPVSSHPIHCSFTLVMPQCIYCLSFSVLCRCVCKSPAKSSLCFHVSSLKSKVSQGIPSVPGFTFVYSSFPNLGVPLSVFCYFGLPVSVICLNKRHILN